MTYPNGEVVSTSYNDAMAPRTLTGSSSYVDNATYNALGLPKMLDLGNNLFQHYTYWGAGLDFTFSGFNTWGRLRAVCVTALTTCADAENNGNVRMHLAYAYDNAGNITNLGDWTTGMHPAYSYDAQDRLTSWSIGGTTQETYSYDALGRMTNRSTLGTFSYGHASKVHAVTGVGAGTFSYDANGNMLSRWQSGTTFTQEWNADNKASRVHGGGQDIRYFYDADGVLVRRTSGGVTTVFVGPHAEWRSDTGWTNYYHFNGQRVAMRNSSGVFWLHGDHLGSASLISTNAGATSGQLRYDPWGQRRVASGNIWTEYTFTDQRQELSIGLMDYDARLYSPALARFISPDSIVPALDNVQDWNRYAYVRHNPMIYTDPSGNIPIPLFTGLIGGVAGGLIGSGADLLYQAAVEGKGLNDINWGSVAQSGIAGAATGAIIGATGGAAAGVLGTGSTLALQAGLGSMGGAVASQAGAAIGGSINSQLNGTDPAREADALGFGKPGKMTVDAMAGAAGPFVSAGVARTATKSAQIVASQMVRAQPQAAMTQISVAATSQSVRVSIKQITTYTLVSTAPRSMQNAARNGAGSHPFSVTSMADGFVQNVVTKQAESACGSRC